MMVALCVPELALAAGADTGESSMSSINSWLMTWIPIAATVLIIVSSIAWIAHMLPGELGGSYCYRSDCCRFRILPCWPFRAELKKVRRGFPGPYLTGGNDEFIR